MNNLHKYNGVDNVQGVKVSIALIEGGVLVGAVGVSGATAEQDREIARGASGGSAQGIG